MERHLATYVICHYVTSLWPHDTGVPANNRYMLHKHGYIQSNTIIPSHPIQSLLTKHFKYCVPRRKQMWSGWIEANIKTWLRWYKYINNQRTSDTLLSCGYGIWTVGNHSDQERWPWCPLAVEDFDRYLLRFWILWWFENIDSIFSAKIYIYYK